jgi:hypothetical protein
MSPRTKGPAQSNNPIIQYQGGLHNPPGRRWHIEKRQLWPEVRRPDGSENGCFAEAAKCWLEPAIAAAGRLYFAVPRASVLINAPTDFSNTVLQVHKDIMAAA